MRRPLFIPLCLILGLFTTTAVAWTFAIYRLSGETMHGLGPVDPDVHCCADQVLGYRSIGFASYSAVSKGGWNTHARITREPPFNWVPGWAKPHIAIRTPGLLRHVEAAGWPLLCLRLQYELAGPGIIQSGALELAWPFGSSRATRTLPLAPMFPAIAINTLFFATLWSLLLFAPRAIRTHLRHRRNLCPRCAYSLLNLPPNSPCPECGNKPKASA